MSDRQAMWCFTHNLQVFHDYDLCNASDDPEKYVCDSWVKESTDPCDFGLALVIREVDSE